MAPLHALLEDEAEVGDCREPHCTPPYYDWQFIVPRGWDEERDQ